MLLHYHIYCPGRRFGLALLFSRRLITIAQDRCATQVGLDSVLSVYVASPWTSHALFAKAHLNLKTTGPPFGSLSVALPSPSSQHNFFLINDVSMPTEMNWSGVAILANAKGLLNSLAFYGANNGNYRANKSHLYDAHARSGCNDGVHSEIQGILQVMEHSGQAQLKLLNTCILPKPLP